VQLSVEGCPCCESHVRPLVPIVSTTSVSPSSYRPIESPHHDGSCSSRRVAGVACCRDRRVKLEMSVNPPFGSGRVIHCVESGE
jgi:hypothetical protein